MTKEEWDELRELLSKRAYNKLEYTFIETEEGPYKDTQETFIVSKISEEGITYLVPQYEEDDCTWVYVDDKPEFEKYENLEADKFTITKKFKVTEL